MQIFAFGINHQTAPLDIREQVPSSMVPREDLLLIAGQYTRTLAAMMLVATLLGMIFTGAGLALSYEPDLPAGATIILLAGVAYLCSALGRGIWLLWRRGAVPSAGKP